MRRLPSSGHWISVVVAVVLCRIVIHRAVAEASESENQELQCSPGRGISHTADECVPCEPGYFSAGYPENEGPCRPCPNNSFADADRFSACIECNPGYVAEEAQAVECERLPCVAGSYTYVSPLEDGIVVCKPCPSDTYSLSEEDSGIQQACMPCPADTHSLSGATNCSCQPGYTNVGGGLDGGGCEPCAAGSFGQNSTCYECAEGTFTDELGASYCTPCKEGEWTEGKKGATICLLLCTEPGSGLLSDNASSTQTQQCVRCPPGSFSSNLTSGGNGTGLTQEGIEKEGDGRRCVPCAPGTFATSSGSLECVPCSPETFAEHEGSQECRECPAGTRIGAPADTTLDVDVGPTHCVPEPCAPGTYRDAAASGTGLSNTTQDTQDDDDDEEEAVQPCVSCPPGSFSESVDASECTSCVGNTFQPAPGQTSCISCPEGSEAAFTGTSCIWTDGVKKKKSQTSVVGDDDVINEEEMLTAEQHQYKVPPNTSDVYQIDTVPPLVIGRLERQLQSFFHRPKPPTIVLVDPTTSHHYQTKVKVSVAARSSSSTTTTRAAAAAAAFFNDAPPTKKRTERESKEKRSTTAAGIRRISVSAADVSTAERASPSSLNRSYWFYFADGTGADADDAALKWQRAMRAAIQDVNHSGSDVALLRAVAPATRIAIVRIGNTSGGGGGDDNDEHDDHKEEGAVVMTVVVTVGMCALAACLVGINTTLMGRRLRRGKPAGADTAADATAAAAGATSAVGSGSGSGRGVRQSHTSSPVERAEGAAVKRREKGGGGRRNLESPQQQQQNQQQQQLLRQHRQHPNQQSDRGGSGSGGGGFGAISTMGGPHQRFGLGQQQQQVQGHPETTLLRGRAGSRSRSAEDIMGDAALGSSLLGTSLLPPPPPQPQAPYDEGDPLPRIDAPKLGRNLTWSEQTEVQEVLDGILHLASTASPSASTQQRVIGDVPLPISKHSVAEFLRKFMSSSSPPEELVHQYRELSAKQCHELGLLLAHETSGSSTSSSRSGSGGAAIDEDLL